MQRYRAIALLTAVSAAAFVASCAGTDEPVVGPTGELLSVCHLSGATGTLIELHASELGQHRSHGDYVAKLLVDKKGVGSADSIHFARVTDALSIARAGRIARKELSSASCHITIAVGPGIFQGRFGESSDPTFERFPLVIDVPELTLQGSFLMPVDANDRAVGAATYDHANPPTTLVASPGLVSIVTGSALDKYAEPLILVHSHLVGSVADGVVIEKFILQSGNAAPDAVMGGNAVWAMRAKRLVVRNNQIEGGFSEPIELRSSVARVEHNYLTGKGLSCALCMFGPGDYQVISNRQTGLANRLGVLIFPTIFAAVPPGVDQLELGATALVTVLVQNNDLRDHQEVPFGIGLRVAGIGPGAPNVVGMARVDAVGNDLSNNRFGIIVETGFPVAGSSLRGDIDLTLDNNVLKASCETPLLVSLNSQQTATGRNAQPSSRNSTYTITFGADVTWNDVWYSHPAGAGNILSVNGATIANGARVPYDADKSCLVR
jgi:hypothetical protein